MSLDSLIKRDEDMYNDAIDIVLNISKSERPRMDFMIKYNLSKTTTVDYITNARRELDKQLTHINSVGARSVFWYQVR